MFSLYSSYLKLLLFSVSRLMPNCFVKDVVTIIYFINKYINQQKMKCSVFIVVGPLTYYKMKRHSELIIVFH